MKTLLRDALHALRARPGALLVAHGGLALALAASLLVSLLAWSLAQTDPTLPAPDRTVMLQFKGNPPGQPSAWFMGSPVFLGPALKARGVPLENIARVETAPRTVRLPGGHYKVFDILLADAELLPLMGLQAMHGNLPESLARPEALAVTTDFVRTLWGDIPPAQALGRTVDAEGKRYQVRAVMPPFGPNHPLFGHELLAGMTSQGAAQTDEDRGAIYMVNGKVFARLRGDAQAAQVGAWMRSAFLAHPGFSKLPKAWSDGREAAFFRAITLPQLRFEGEENELRWTALTALGAACALLVLMAAFNALNLHAAQLLQRQRETALRQSLGMNHRQLLTLWATEQGLALLAAAATGLLLAWWLAPALVLGLGVPPSTDLFSPAPWPVLLGLAGVLCLLLLLNVPVPAALALRQPPARALQGRTASEGPWGRRLRQALLTLQLSSALLLLALTGVLAVQHQHLLHMDHGYQLDGRLQLDVWAKPEDAPRLKPLVEAIQHHPAVQSWSFSSSVPGGGWSGTIEHYRRAGAVGPSAVLRATQVSSTFFATYGMKLLAGDPTSPLRGEARVVLDAHAARLLGFANPQAAIGTQLLAGGDFMAPGQDARRVVAVVGDVKLESAREPAQPQSFVITDAYQPFLTVYGPDPAQLHAAVDTLWKRFDLPFFHMLDEVAEQRRIAYQQEALLAGLLGVVALLAVTAAAVGAYALVADTLRRRRTELVLRRLHGASTAAVARSALREFALPLALAVLVALPLAAGLAHLYREGFVDQAPLGPGMVLPLLAAAVFTALVVALAALRHTAHAVALRPIEALR